MSPPPTTKSQARRRQTMLVSLIVVVAVSFGTLGGALAAGWHPLLGLDLDGGLSVVYKAPPNTSADNLSETVNVLTARVDAYGVSGAKVETQGNTVVVSIPGIKNPDQVIKTIGQTAQLYFRPVLCFASPYVGDKSKTAKPASAALPACAAGTQVNASTLNVNTSTGNPTGNIATDTALADYPSTASQNDTQNKTVLLPVLSGQGSDRLVLGPAPITGHIVKSALAQEDTTGAWSVLLNLTGAGSSAWDTFAQQQFHTYIAIDLDGLVQSFPLTQPNQTGFTSFQGSVQISGGSSFTQSYAQQLAISLNYGSLPVRLTPQTTQTVSPTLGRSSLDAGLGAGAAGLALVLLYVILYYRFLGLVVVSGLAVTAALLWGIVSLLGHSSNLTLDLAGVTGVIVSIGITVDSYIVYFERLKDETRSGRTVRTSVDRGFASAWRTVVAADFVSLMGAVLLYFISVGTVKGFAFFLGLSTVLDLLVTYFFTRPLVVLLGRNERVTEARRFGIAKGLASGPVVGAEA